ncbi:MAG: hypothetical protein ACD_75C01576G0002 [uncultured bacterium]|nr:MAG: hypothetical protein ACD_75C01576G0002 [uncultured bacterium]
MHQEDLRPFLFVSRLLRIYAAADDDQVGQFAEPAVPTVPFDQAGEVLDMIETGHGKDQGLLSIGQHAPALRMRSAEEQPLDFLDKPIEAAVVVPVGEIDVLIGAGRDDIEFWIEGVDALDHPLELRHGEGRIALVLADHVGGARDLLIGRGDDEVRRVHGDHIGGELAGEMVLFLHLLPVKGRIEILCFFQGVGDGALGDAEAFGHDVGDQIAVRIVADDEIGPAAEDSHHLVFGLVRESLQIGPDLEAGDPLRQNRAVAAAEWDSDDMDVVGAFDFFLRDITGSTAGFGDEPGHDQDLRSNVEAVVVDARLHLPLKRPHLIEDIDDLAAGIGQTEDIFLAEVAVGRNDGDVEDHRHQGDETHEGLVVRGLQQVGKPAEALADLLAGPPPARCKAERFKVRRHILPLAFRGPFVHVLHAVGQRRVQFPDIPDPIVDHEWLVAIAMDPQEGENQLIAAGEIAGQPVGEGPIEKFHAVADGADLGHLGEIPLKGLEIEFQDRPGRRAQGDLLLEGEKVGHADLRHFLIGEGVSEIMPAGDLGADGQTQPFLVDHRLLGLGKGLAQHRGCQLCKRRFTAEGEKLVPQLTL